MDYLKHYALFLGHATFLYKNDGYSTFAWSQSEYSLILQTAYDEARKKTRCIWVSRPDGEPFSEVDSEDIDEDDYDDGPIFDDFVVQ